MNGQRIATYEEMGIQSLLQKYKNNTLDPVDLINDIYDRIELNDATDGNPILISRVSRDASLERIAELKELRASLSPGIDFTNEYPLWGIPFVVKDIVGQCELDKLPELRLSAAFRLARFSDSRDTGI
jgi:allophanate hydrolase